MHGDRILKQGRSAFGIWAWLSLVGVAGSACIQEDGTGIGADVTPQSVRAALMSEQIQPILSEYPDNTGANQITQQKIDLGRMLYYDNRLSRDQNLSCNGCHDLGMYGVDIRPGPDMMRAATSAGAPAQPGVGPPQFGDRNAPTVYHAAAHLAQFWDGREPDVEAQAGGPILNPIEMAMPDKPAVMNRLRAVPGYQAAFAAAFPNQPDPFFCPPQTRNDQPCPGYTNLRQAIAAFERRLVTPAPIDRFLMGEDGALSPMELQGANLFVSKGCASCHQGETVGGKVYRRMCAKQPCMLTDVGRMKITMKPTDLHVFKVPSLRNIDQTFPYMHDGSVKTLEEAVRMMARHQLSDPNTTEAEVQLIVAFLRTLTGPLPTVYIAPPMLP